MIQAQIVSAMLIPQPLHFSIAVFLPATANSEQGFNLVINTSASGAGYSLSGSGHLSSWGAAYAIPQRFKVKVQGLQGRQHLRPCIALSGQQWVRLQLVEAVFNHSPVIADSLLTAAHPVE
jgi:hypothetical protein